MGAELFSHCLNPMQHCLLSKIYTNIAHDKLSRNQELPTSVDGTGKYILHGGIQALPVYKA